MKRIGLFLNFLEKHSSWRNIVIGFGFIVFINLVAIPMLPKLFTNADIPIDKMLDVQFGFTPAFVQELLSYLMECGRRAYLFSAIFIDTPYALAYGFIYSFLLISVLKRKRRLKELGHLALTPFLISIFDLIENSGIIYFITTFPDYNEGSVGFISLANQLKWIFAILTFFTFIVFLLIPAKIEHNRTKI